MSPGMQAGNDGRSSGSEGSPLGRVKSLGSGGKSLGSASQADKARAKASSPAAKRREGVIGRKPSVGRCLAPKPGSRQIQDWLTSPPTSIGASERTGFIEAPVTGAPHTDASPM